MHEWVSDQWMKIIKTNMLMDIFRVACEQAHLWVTCVSGKEQSDPVGRSLVKRCLTFKHLCSISRWQLHYMRLCLKAMFRDKASMPMHPNNWQFSRNVNVCGKLENASKIFLQDIFHLYFDCDAASMFFCFSHRLYHWLCWVVSWCMLAVIGSWQHITCSKKQR